MKTQEIPYNLGSGTCVQIVLQTDTERLLIAHNTPEIKLMVPYIFYKTT